MPEQFNSSVGYYTVVYSYTVGGEFYTGKFVDFGRSDESYLKRNDTVSIRYYPHRPAESYYPELRTQTNFRLLSACLGAVIGALVVAIAWWAHRGRFYPPAIA